VAITPDYAEIAKLCDLWLAPKQGTDAAMALAMGHVMLREFHLDKPSQYFTDYVRRYTDMPMLVMLEERDGYYAAGRMLRAADLVTLSRKITRNGKPSLSTATAKWLRRTVQLVSAGVKKANGTLSSVTVRPAMKRTAAEPAGSQDDIAEVGFPYWRRRHRTLSKVELENILLHKLPVKRLQLADGSTALVTTVYDLTMANYGLERGLNDENCATSYDDIKAYAGVGRKNTGVSRRTSCASPVNLPITPIRRMSFDDYRRRRSEPLVPPRYELSWPDQHAGVLRLYRSERRLGALRGQENCVRRPAGSRWRLRSTGSVRRVT
jgi:nitrate reductase alpha subunit